MYVEYNGRNQYSKNHTVFSQILFKNYVIYNIIEVIVRVEVFAVILTCVYKYLFNDECK